MRKCLIVDTNNTSLASHHAHCVHHAHHYQPLFPMLLLERPGKYRNKKSIKQSILLHIYIGDLPPVN